MIEEFEGGRRAGFCGALIDLFEILWSLKLTSTAGFFGIGGATF